MSQNANAWLSGVIVVVTAVALAAGIIGGLVVFGGQDWLIPGQTTSAAVSTQTIDENFGLAEYVDRTLILDREGRLTVDGAEYDDAALREYLRRLRDGGGVRVLMRVDSDGPSQRRATVEKISEEVTGMKPEIFYGIEMKSPLANQPSGSRAASVDLNSDLTAP